MPAPRNTAARSAARLLYESGDLSNTKEIAARVGVTERAIQKWLKQDGWIVAGSLESKALEASSEQIANANLKRGERWDEQTTSNVRGREQTRAPERHERSLTVVEQTIVEIGAQVLTQVRLQQRDDVARARRLATQLLVECEHLTGQNDLFEMVGEMLFNPDRYGRDKLNELYQAVIQLPGRVKVLRELSDALGTLITLERGVHGLPPVDPPPPPRPKPPTGTLDSPQDTYRWLAGIKGATLDQHAVEDAVERTAQQP